MSLSSSAWFTGDDGPADPPSERPAVPVAAPVSPRTLPVTPAERTPATVLRAMLVSYTLADLDARAAWVPERSHDAPWFVSGRRAAYLAGCVKDLMLEAELCARRPDRSPELGPDGALAADYAARLAGTTPIDAPPAKEPR